MIVIKGITQQIPDEEGNLRPVISPERWPTKEEEKNSGGWFRYHNGYYYFIEASDSLTQPATPEEWTAMDSLLEAMPKA